MATLSPTSTYQKSFRYFHTNSSPPLIFSPIHPHRLSFCLRANPTARLRRCLASASPGPPSPPEGDPPRPNDPIRLRGPAATFSRIQDRIQIFFAVLFWMSLFFWAFAWDGKDGGGPNKGSRFRR